MSSPSSGGSQNLLATPGTLRVNDKCYATTGADGLEYTGLALKEGLNIAGLCVTCMCILLFGAISASSSDTLAIIMLVCCCSSLGGGIWNEWDTSTKKKAIIARSPAIACA